VSSKGEWIPESATDKMLELAQRLKHLHLSMGDHFTFVKNFTESFPTFMRAASNLECLTLDINDKWDVKAWWIAEITDRGYGPTKLMEYLNTPDITFASLKTITISNAICKQEDLEGFLFRHSQTLRSLTLQNVALTRNASSFRCGVQMLENLRDNLQLDHFTIKGGLNNTGVQNLLFGHGESLPYMTHGKLRRAVELWVTGKSDMPEILARVAIQSGKKDLELPRMTEDEIVGTGIYALLPNLKAVSSLRPIRNPHNSRVLFESVAPTLSAVSNLRPIHSPGNYRVVFESSADGWEDIPEHPRMPGSYE